MTSAEQACYTLINVPTDSEPPNEMQLKTDLGKLLVLSESTENWIQLSLHGKYIEKDFNLLVSDVHIWYDNFEHLNSVILKWKQPKMRDH